MQASDRPGTNAKVSRLVAEVAARHGIRIDADDPAFCLVTLNQLMLEETAEQVLEAIRIAIVEFEEAAKRVQNRAGTVLAWQLRDTLDSMRMAAPGVPTHAGKSRTQRPSWRRAHAAIPVGLVAFLFGFAACLLMSAF